MQGIERLNDHLVFKLSPSFSELLMTGLWEKKEIILAVACFCVALYNIQNITTFCVSLCSGDKSIGDLLHKGFTTMTDVIFANNVVLNTTEWLVQTSEESLKVAAKYKYNY